MEDYFMIFDVNAYCEVCQKETEQGDMYKISKNGLQEVYDELMLCGKLFVNSKRYFVERKCFNCKSKHNKV
jgi:hypothetical protein